MEWLEDVTTKKYSPWSRKLVQTLNEYQKDNYYSYPCTECRVSLIPTINGFVCQYCGYTQDWCHDIDHELITERRKEKIRK